MLTFFGCYFRRDSEVLAPTTSRNTAVEAALAAVDAAEGPGRVLSVFIDQYCCPNVNSIYSLNHFHFFDHDYF